MMGKCNTFIRQNYFCSNSHFFNFQKATFLSSRKSILLISTNGAKNVLYLHIYDFDSKKIGFIILHKLINYSKAALTASNT